MALLKLGLAGAITAPLYWVLSSSDRWFLEYYHGPEAVGLYSLSYSVATAGTMVNGAVSSVWLPEAAREYEQDAVRAQASLGRLMSRLIIVMAIVWLATTAAGGDVVRLLASKRFHAAAEYIAYIAGGVFCYGVLHLANAGLLLAKKLNWAALWWLGGGLICGLLNCALVPKLGGKGAAITQCASFAFISLGIFATSQIFLRVHLDWRQLAVGLVIIAAAGVSMAPPWHRQAIISLLLKLPLGIIVAILVVWMTMPDWCRRLIQLMRRKTALWMQLAT
jgi:O-antigen/teichoic acid export membrane protein